MSVEYSDGTFKPLVSDVDHGTVNVDTSGLVAVQLGANCSVPPHLFTDQNIPEEQTVEYSVFYDTCSLEGDNLLFTLVISVGSYNFYADSREEEYGADYNLLLSSLHLS